MKHFYYTSIYREVFKILHMNSFLSLEKIPTIKYFGDNPKQNCHSGIENSCDITHVWTISPP